MDLFFTVNSGVCLRENGAAIFVDGVHAGEKVGFSPMPPALRRTLCGLAGPRVRLDGLLFTHAHPDHFDRDRLEALGAQAPLPPIHVPGREGGADCRPFLPGTAQVCIDGWTILAVDTVHAGAAFADVPHQSYLIRRGGAWIFLAGDARLGAAEGRRVRGLCAGMGTAAALVNPMQLLDPQGALFLRALAPGSVFLYHLPLPEEDRLGCYALARQARARYPKDLPPLRALNPMSWTSVQSE